MHVCVWALVDFHALVNCKNSATQFLPKLLIYGRLDNAVRCLETEQKRKDVRQQYATIAGSTLLLRRCVVFLSVSACFCLRLYFHAFKCALWILFQNFYIPSTTLINLHYCCRRTTPDTVSAHMLSSCALKYARLYFNVTE